MNRAFEQRRDYEAAALNNMPGVSCQLPKGAFYVFPNISGVVENLGIDKAYASLSDENQRTTSPSTLFQMFLLWNYHLATMDRKSFGQIGAQGKHYLGLSIATSMDDLKTGIQRMAAALEDKAGFAAFIAAHKHFS